MSSIHLHSITGNDFFISTALPGTGLYSAGYDSIPSNIPTKTKNQYSNLPCSDVYYTTVTDTSYGKDDRPLDICYAIYRCHHRTAPIVPARLRS